LTKVFQARISGYLSALSGYFPVLRDCFRFFSLDISVVKVILAFTGKRLAKNNKMTALHFDGGFDKNHRLYDSYT
jgi:hypothetical protein